MSFLFPAPVLHILQQIFLSDYIEANRNGQSGGTRIPGENYKCCSVQETSEYDPLLLPTQEHPDRCSAYAVLSTPRQTFLLDNTPKEFQH